MTTSSRRNPPFSAGDVLRVPVLFTDQRGVKERPAVVVSVDEFHTSRSDVIVVPLSSSGRPYFGDRELIDWREAGLARPSYIKAVLATVEARSIIRVWGRLSARDYASVQDALRDVLDL